MSQKIAVGGCPCSMTLQSRHHHRKLFENKLMGRRVEARILKRESRILREGDLLVPDTAKEKVAVASGDVGPSSELGASISRSLDTLYHHTACTSTEHVHL